jgi:hypothetical protein
MAYVSCVLAGSSLTLQQLYTSIQQDSCPDSRMLQGFAETLFCSVPMRMDRTACTPCFPPFFVSGVDSGLLLFGFCVIMTVLICLLVFVDQHIADILISSPA